MTRQSETLERASRSDGAALLQAPAAAAPAPDRTMTVETHGLGTVKVRRVTLGGIARAAERLRGMPDADEAALVDALIVEVATPTARASGAGRRRLEPSELERLSGQDRSAIAVAVLTLEGVKADGEGVQEDPRLVLARRYGRIVGTGERVNRSVQAAVRPLTSQLGRLKRTLSSGTIEAITRGLASSAALREILKEDDWLLRLRQDPEFSLDLDELLESGGPAEPGSPDPRQMPLFEGASAAVATAADAGDAPDEASGKATRSRTGGDAAAPAPARGAGTVRGPGAAERMLARIEDVAESQRQLLQWQAQTRETVSGAVAELAARAQVAERAGRRNLWLAGAAIALAALVGVAQLAWSISLKRELVATQERLQAQAQQHEDALRELHKAFGARAEPRATPRVAPQQDRTAPPARRPATKG